MLRVNKGANGELPTSATLPVTPSRPPSVSVNGSSPSSYTLPAPQHTLHPCILGTQGSKGTQGSFITHGGFMRAAAGAAGVGAKLGKCL